MQVDLARDVAQQQQLRELLFVVELNYLDLDQQAFVAILAFLERLFVRHLFTIIKNVGSVMHEVTVIKTLGLPLALLPKKFLLALLDNLLQ